ncbi:hypothetical protein [Mesorhizobium kowhaii]|nr:hypothetical protein [Mesorhizobium kowhaii]
MPSTRVPAAGEAVPATEVMPILGRFSRRALLGVIASVPTLMAATAASGSTTPETIDDPLLDAVRAFRAGMADYNVNSPDDDDEAVAYIEVSYGPPMEVLEEWEQPAKTHAGALEALRLVAEENSAYEASPLVGPLLAAAIAYFEVQS